MKTFFYKFIWTENALNFQRRPFSGLHFCTENPTNFWRRPFFCSSPTFRHNFHQGCHTTKNDTTKSRPGCHHPTPIFIPLLKIIVHTLRRFSEKFYRNDITRLVTCWSTNSRACHWHKCRPAF